MNSGYSDVRYMVYMVYIWEFSCLDYSFNILTSWIDNLGLYNWFYHIFFTYCLLICSCMPMLMTQFQYMLLDSDLPIHMCLSMHATWHSPYYSLGSSDSPGPTCSDLGAWIMVDFLVIRVAQWISNWPSRALSFLPPPLVSWVFLL